MTIPGRTFNGDQDRRIRPAQVGETIRVRGKDVAFDVDARTFTVRNDSPTGADSPRADNNLPIDAPTVVFKSKVPNHGETLTDALELDLNNEGEVLESSDGGQDVEIQAKDRAQGGLFQMEPEPGITETNTLGPDSRYTEQQAGQERLCFTNGAFSGYDSPELAIFVSNTDKDAVWSVRSGGRVGMVIGKDTVEGGCRP